MVGIDEEFGEIIPPTLGVQSLSVSVSFVYISYVYGCLPYTLALVYPAGRQEAQQLSEPLQDTC